MNEDPRMRRTRVALTEALLRLLADGALTTISVATLCAEADVHRTTFYNHAPSIDAFAMTVVGRDFDEVATVGHGRPGTKDEYRQAMVDVLTHVAGRRPLYRALLGSPWSGALRNVLIERMEARVSIALDAFAAYPDADVPGNRDEIVAFVAGGLVGAIVLWAAGDDRDCVAGAARIQALMPTWWPVR